MTRKLTLQLFLTLALSATAVAIQPGRWAHTTEADFEKGQTKDTVVTNLGDVKLATASAKIGDLPEEITVIYDLQSMPDGSTYAAAGPEGTLLRQKADKVDTVLTLKDEQVFCLSTLGNDLLVGVSGEKTSRLAVLKDDKLETVAELPDARYIWDVVIEQKMIYVATGIEGKLYAVDTAGKEAKVTQVIDAPQANLLCIGRDGKGRLYAGTDTEGLVYRITPNENAAGGYEAFVLFDAPEPEIGAIFVTSGGYVYAGTADANQAKPGRLQKPAAAETGRPEKPAEGGKEGDLPGVQPKPKPTATPATPDAPKPTDAPKSPDAPKPDASQPQATPPAAPEPAPQSAGEPAPPAAAAPPTPEQMDQLRQEIRARLDKARQSGALQAGPNMAAPPGVNRPAGATSQRRSPSGQQAKQGNAVYRIDPVGFVSEVFRESAMILAIADDGDGLLVATGNEGQLYRIVPDAGETTILADLEPQQITSVMRRADGTILLGTSNSATIVRLDGGYATTGTYQSPVQDAQQISLWGKLKITGDTPKGTSLTVETRTGNVEDPDQAAWSPWSKPQAIEHDPKRLPLTPIELTIESPPARFLQYRVTLKGDGKVTSVLDRAEVAYVVPNMKPDVASIKAEYAGAPATAPTGGARPAGAAKVGEPKEQAKLNIQWEATDPNGDGLTYTLQMRIAGGDAWLPIAENLATNRYEWDTRRVPDGRYLIRVTASDAPGNTPDMVLTATRQSNPVLIDNTPPTFENVATAPIKGGLRVTGAAADALSDVQTIHYAIDSTDDWQPVLPDDLIFDSTSERFTITISDLAPGPHVVTLRTTDELGNAQYKAIQVELK